MKNLVFALVFSVAHSAFAMPNPTYTTLAESLPVSQYIDNNIGTIVQTSAELAKIAVPNAHYFLITNKITIFPPTAFSDNINKGTSPIATIFMSGNTLDCERDVFTKAQYDAWGGKKNQQFFLTSQIRCKRQAGK
ncbi:MAG: hypothetical protein EOP04_30585 [Proteobacteria bacterium]|nr:MAG: hypothetical protein EOP04_30585 [Pseudomonadota bacterium]